MASFKLNLLQSFDRRFGPALCRLFKPTAAGLRQPDRRPEPDTVRRILVIRPGGLGDAALTLPMLGELHDAFAGARIDVLAERRNAGIYALSNSVGSVYCYDSGILKQLRKLRALRYDIVIDTEQFHFLSVLFANLLRPRFLCGFGAPGRQKFQTHTVAYSDETYEAQSFLDLAGALTGQSLSFGNGKPFLPVPAEQLRWAREQLAVAGDRRVVAIAPLASGAARIWPVHRFAEVAAALISEQCFIVVLGGRDAIDTAARFTSLIDTDTAAVLNLAGRTNLVESAAILRCAGALICSDTGVLHVAAGVGTPTVSLFGSGLHRKWAPLGDRHTMIRKGLACSPCITDGQLPPCPHGFACMLEIETAEVLSAVRHLFNA